MNKPLLASLLGVLVTGSAVAASPGKGALSSERDFLLRYERLKKVNHEIVTALESRCKGETCLLETIVERDKAGKAICKREVLVPKKDAILITLFQDMVTQGEPQTNYSLSIYKLEREHLLKTGNCIPL